MLPVKPLTTCTSLLQRLFLPLLLLMPPLLHATQAAEEDNGVQGEGPFEWNIGGTIKDEQGSPVPHAVVETIPKMGKTFQTTGTENGRFRLRFRSLASYRPAFLVWNESKTMSSFVAGFDHHRQRKLFRIVLQPNHNIVVDVKDENGQPIEDALVGVIANYNPIAAAKSNSEGVARIEIPADAKIDWIYARKSGAGFDYYENYHAFPTQERFDSPKQVSLKLEGACNVRVKTIDTDGKPIGNVRVLPWTIKLPEKLSYINLSGISEFSSNDTGIAEFGWIPKNLVGSITFLSRHEDYHCPQPSRYAADSESDSGTTNLEVELLKVAVIRGKVTMPDGNAAARIHIQGEGRGNTNFYFRGHTITDGNGNYQLKIYPNQSTIIAVTEKVWAAKSHTKIKLEEGMRKENVDFQLASGTLIHGLATIGNDKIPAAGENATLLEKADGTDLVRWNNTDQDGHYEFRVGPGEYELKLPNRPYSEKLSITVSDQKEIVHHTHAERKERGTLTGQTVDKGGKPIAGCVIMGESLGNFGHAGFKTRSKEDGSFSTERWNDPMIVYAFHDQKNMAGIATLSAADEKVALNLQGASAASGRLVDKAGKPIANCRTQLLLSPEGGHQFGGFAIFTTTDREGRYSFSGIPVNSSCSIHHYIEQDSINGPSFEVKSTSANRLEDSVVE